MAARIKHSMSSGKAGVRARIPIALHGSLAILIVTIGVLGLLHGTWPRRIVESWINIHLLFTLLLCGTLFAQYQSRLMHSPRLLETDVRALSGQLSRTVYLFLYVVLGVRQGIDIIGIFWHGGAADLGSNEVRFRNAGAVRVFDLKDDFQLLLASGLCALVMGRLLAFGIWRRLLGHVRPAPRRASIDESSTGLR